MWSANLLSVCSFSPSQGSFAKCSILMKSNLSMFSFMDHASGIKWKNSLLNLDHEGFSTMFFFFLESFIFTLKFVIHFKFYVKCEV